MASKHPRASHPSFAPLFGDVESFAALEQRIAALLSTRERGDAFEVFAEAYLATQRITEAAEVWPFEAIPLRERKSLGLDTGRDMGVDGLYRTTSGERRAYQVKFRAGRPKLTWEELSTFMGLSDRVGTRVLFTNCDALPDLMADRTGFFVIRGSDLDRLAREDFEAIRDWLGDKPAPAARYAPKSHQQETLEAIDKAMTAGDRATVVMACGTGKTLVALWAAERSRATRVLVLVPSLALVRQLLHEWLRQTSWERLSYLCVCSDPTVARGDDSLVVRQEDLDFPVTTHPAAVRRFLKRPFEGVKVVFSTYQSAAVVAEGMDEPFQLGIFDEAHKTAGREGTRFSFALDDRNLPITKRIFFTATPRHYDIRKRDEEGDARLVYSMDNPAIYGPIAHVLPFAEAARRGIICDYKVVISVVTDEMVNDHLLSHGEVLIDGEEVKARQVAVQIALERAVEEFRVKKIFTFHGSVKAARSFTSEGPEGVATHLKGFGSYHVSGEMPTALREEHMKAFREDDMAVMSNARCLTEGVDVPAVDMVAFMSPRRSKVDIIQATGRAMRKAPDKQVGYVLVPVFMEAPKGETLDDAVRRTGFDDVWDVLAAMREQDQALADVIAELREERGRTGGYNEARLRERVVVLGPEVSLEALQAAVTAECVDRIGSSWDESFGLLAKFKAREGHCRVPDSHREANFNLGRWVRHQRELGAALGRDKRARLDAIGFDWDPFATAFEQGFAALGRFKTREGHCLAPATHKEGDYPLGNWVASLRANQERLSRERKERLDSLGFDWDPLASAWEEGLAGLKRFKEREGHCRVPFDHVEGTFRLGGWVIGQRHRPKLLTNERRARLEAVGFIWDAQASAWEEGFAALERFKRREAHCRVPQKHVEGGYPLGTWVAIQRKWGRTGRLLTERKERLDRMGFDWDPYATDWERSFTALRRFKEREGHCRVPGGHVEDGVRLGVWVGGQRQSKDELPTDRRTVLDAIGFEWDPRSAAWEDGYAALLKYRAREGHCLVPARYVEDGYKLGQWVSLQRLNRSLRDEYRKRLDAVGFEWDPFSSAWERGFAALRAFHAREGHCRVPNRHVEDGVNLGTWVNNVRRRLERLPPDRRASLRAIGFDRKVSRAPRRAK